ncbi:MAG: response regulator [Alphaproteobacteria bacterium]|nr:response regulator [Alphaproteobacteria bacterium]
MVEFNRSHEYDHLRVLVLEDEGHIRRIVCRLLRQIGFKLIHDVANGADGFKELLRVKPHVILCDIHMEPIDGMTFLRKLRALGHPEFSRIPVIFLTADAQRETVVEAKDLHVDGYLVKPISPKQLKERIDAVLFQDMDSAR